MRILVTGSRHLREAHRETVISGIVAASRLVPFSPTDPGTLVHGGGIGGADWLAASIADNWVGWTPEPHPADWDKHGRAAGPIRNTYMVQLGADVCVAFPQRASVGTIDCLKKAIAAGIMTLVIPVAEV